MKTTRREFIKSVGALTAVPFAGKLFAAAKNKRLNILFIMSDDHAAHAISAYGSKVNKTPHIDSLAKEGMIFTDVICTNPICTPSRAGILTGRYSHNNGVPVFNDISPEIKTIGGHMRDAGYYTAFIGKWHCGGPATIRNSDWDKWMLYSGQGVYNDPWYWTRSEDGSGYIKKSYPGEYATENITKCTIEMLDEAIESGKPFFAMMHHKAPHRNWIPSAKYKDVFRKKTLADIPMPESIFDDYNGRATPIKTTSMTLLSHMRLGLDLKLAEYFSAGYVFEFEGRRYEGRKNSAGDYVDDWPEGMDDRARTALSYLRYMQDYLAVVQSIDDSVGDMNDYLERKGVANNTLVIYTSDQGFFLGDHGLYDKRFIMEESLKMPFLCKCPAFIKPGSVNSELVANIDFAPTFLDIANVPKPEEMQGESFLCGLEDPSSVNGREACYCRYYVEGGEHATAAWYGVRTKTDKLVYYYKRDEWEYFDLLTDPDELHNGYTDVKYQLRIAKLKKILYDLKAKTGDFDQYKDCQEYSL